MSEYPVEDTPARDATQAPAAGARRAGGSRRAEPARRRGRGCLPVLLLVAALAAVGFVAGGTVIDKVKEFAGSSPDFAGPGTSRVVVEVKAGDSAAAIGRTLKAEGVVKSVDAFTDAAVADERSRSIQVGFYALKREMRAADALAVLVDATNLIQARVTIPEGSRLTDIVAAIDKQTDITAAQVRAVLAKPGQLGLPAAAKGNPEGYLFPATYDVAPGQTALELVRAMVAKAKQVEDSLDLEGGAAKLGLTPGEVMTVASILEFEASRDQDYPKIAQAIYNRLQDGMPLQVDATVHYANNSRGTVFTTAEERQIDSPYNTYRYPGLPPGPIGSPGEKTLKAALNPVDGPWRYWVVVDLETGETRFNETYEAHLRDVEVFRAYCRASDAC